MSFNSSQIITVSLIGLATAVGVAAATIQAGRMKQSQPPVAESPVSDENQSTITPANNSASRKPELSTPDNRGSESRKSASQTAKNSAIQSSSQVAGVSQQKAGPVIVTPPNSGCKITQAVVSDPNPPLNVRSKPQVSDSNVVGKLKNDTFVSIAEERDGWLRITDPVPGWIAKNRTESSCATVKQQINFLPGGDEAIVKGRIIGGGSHSYLIRATKGQRMTVKNRKQVFPSIFTPDGKLLAGDPNTQGTKTEWEGKVPVTGNYTFQLDSNFRGYEYEFSVRLR
ncbi:MAG: SH3 domain-containing protein [Microcoleus sp.]